MLVTFKYFKPRIQAQPTFQDEVLRRLTMPLLAIVGGRDAMLDSRQTKRRLEAAVPHATVRLLPRVGHRLPDQSDVIAEFLRDSSVVVPDGWQRLQHAWHQGPHVSAERPQIAQRRATRQT